MESPQQLDLPSWHMLYGSDLEEERLMARLTHPSLMLSLHILQKDLLSSVGDF